MEKAIQLINTLTDAIVEMRPAKELLLNIVQQNTDGHPYDCVLKAITELSGRFRSLCLANVHNRWQKIAFYIDDIPTGYINNLVLYYDNYCYIMHDIKRLVDIYAPCLRITTIPNQLYADFCLFDELNAESVLALALPEELVSQRLLERFVNLQILVIRCRDDAKLSLDASNLRLSVRNNLNNIGTILHIDESLEQHRDVILELSRSKRCIYNYYSLFVKLSHVKSARNI